MKEKEAKKSIDLKKVVDNISEDSEEKNVEEETPKKSEEEILFPEIEIKGFEAKPWTLGILRRINPHIENVFVTLKNKNIVLTLENFESHILDLYFASLPEIMAILAISLNVEESVIEELSIEDAVQLIFLVFKQNEESIKNVSSLLRAG